MIEKRRDEILNILKKEINPINGSELGEKFDVSRQVIVQDIALLRARGEQIVSTPRGYFLMKETSGLIKKIVSEHGKDDLEDELRIIVDNGARVVDVIVEHPVYKEIKACLDLSSRADVDQFLRDLNESKGEPLLSLTGGIHIHTIEVVDEDMFLEIERQLFEKGYLKK